MFRSASQSKSLATRTLYHLQAYTLSAALAQPRSIRARDLLRPVAAHLTGSKLPLSSKRFTQLMAVMIVSPKHAAA